MSEIRFQLLNPNDHATIQQMAQWYVNEWKIPLEKTKEKFAQFSPQEFQVIMTLDHIPVATGGIYHRVGLVEREPRFAVHQHWLALVYTLPEKRGKGLGAQLCAYIQHHAKTLGLKELHLFTDTAETLYQRLDWQLVERLNLGERKIAVMKKNL